MGLIVLSCFYVVAGAAIFWSLERPHEIAVRQRNLETISLQKREFLMKLWLIEEDISESEWRLRAKNDIDNITKVLFNAFDTHYITAHHLNSNGTETRLTWTFQAAIFFTSTLLTTIGWFKLLAAMHLTLDK